MLVINGSSNITKFITLSLNQMYSDTIYLNESAAFLQQITEI